MTETPLRTVLVGLGRVGMGYADDPAMARWIKYASHAQVLADHPAFEWGAAIDPSEAARRRATARWNVPLASASPELVAERYRPEVAVLATPPAARLEIVDRLPSLRAVMVEKPLGRTLAEAEEFLAACAERAITVQVNLWRRGDARFRTLAAGDLRSEIGRPQVVFGVYGNGLANNGPHIVDFIRMLAGEFEFVQALPGGAAGSGPMGAESCDVGFTGRLAGGGAAAVLPLDFREYREVGLDIWGDRGRLQIMQEGLTITAYPRRDNRSATGQHEIASDQPIPLESTVGHAFYHLYTNLADAMEERSELWSPGESALRAEEIVQAVAQSLAGGGTIVECAAGARG